MKTSKFCVAFIFLFFFSTISPNTQIGILQTKASNPNQVNTFSLFILADYAFIQLYGVDSVSLIYELVQTVNSYYQQSGLNMQFYVAKIMIDLTNESFVSPDLISGQIDANTYLTNFDTWARGNSTASSYDLGQLVSGYDFVGGTIGLGYIGTLGTIHPYSIVQATYASVHPFIASTMAHEIGHNFDASHDGVSPNSCSSTGYIMAAAGDPKNPYTTFSSCSISEINSFISTLPKNYVDIENPIVTHPSDITTDYDSNNAVLISWIIGDANPYEYSITQDGMPSLLFSWYSNGTITYVFVKTTSGIFNIVLNVTDGAGNSVLDTVQVVVNSNLAVIHSPDVNTTESSLSTIWFNVTGTYKGYFNLYKNGVLNDTGYWNQGLNYSISLFDLPMGHYNFTFQVFGISVYGVNATVIVDITHILTIPPTTITTTPSTTSTPLTTSSSPPPTSSTPPSTHNTGNSTPTNPLPFFPGFILFIVIPFLRRKRN